MLWLAIHLPCLALEALPGPAEGPPRVVTVLRGGRERVHCADARARAAGICPGLPLGGALALLPSLHAVARREAAEQATVQALLGWAGQFSACVAAQGAAGIVLEAGASRALFGGLDALLVQVRAGLRQLGHEAGIAIAPTPAGASLLAQAAGGAIAETPEALAQRLAGIPLQALEDALEPGVVARLAGVGLRHLGELRRLPQGSLRRRYGAGLCRYLERLYGAYPDLITPWQPPARYQRRLELPAPVWQLDALGYVLGRLLEELRGLLRARGAAVPGLHLDLEHGRGRSTVVSLERIAPTSEVAHLRVLLQEKLARTPLPAPVEALCLRTEALLPADAPQRVLFAELAPPTQGLDMLCERLRARLGEDAVTTPGVRADYRPERAGLVSAPAGGGAVLSPAPRPPGPRPVWLLERPQALRQRGGVPCLEQPLRLRAGPERIHSGWWDGADIARDYYLADHPDGRRLWVYRHPGGRWFLHGLFA